MDVNDVVPFPEFLHPRLGAPEPLDPQRRGDAVRLAFQLHVGYGGIARGIVHQEPQEQIGVHTFVIFVRRAPGRRFGSAGTRRVRFRRTSARVNDRFSFRVHRYYYRGFFLFR